MDCLFCKIISGTIPCYKVYEDESVLAFLDIHPCSKGHTVVIPKEHVETIEEMNTETFQRIAGGVKAVAERVKAQLKPDAMNIGINNGKAAGQAVPHVHWHIIPRYVRDGGGSMHSIVRSKEQINVEEVAKLFI